MAETHGRKAQNKTKQKKLNEPSFGRFDQMWLLIFDRQVDFHYDMSFYVKALNQEWPLGQKDRRDFDRHFIIGHPFFLSSEGGSWRAEELRNET